ncbi:FxLYD domain-containing protein [Halobellus rarus]|uniref:FxLYD domain-containing protein n=1 Tax=Halobellus rarus TaxID=1126237 RepID=A0ABD6CUR5_9EURY|nr:FxLYD domain-containing protein [Halobellus rarus]
MKRRQFIQTVGIGTATASLAGCTAPGGTPDGTTDVANGDEADILVTLVRNAPENPGPYEDPVGTVTPQESEELILDGFTFQRAGEKGLVVAGDATNAGDRQLQNVVVEVTLHDRNETEDEILDSASEQTTHERLDTGETWQWATTFDEQEFQIDYYVIRATASYV